MKHIKLAVTNNPCISLPCLNGATCTYIQITDSYVCTCAPGFIGANCALSNLNKLYYIKTRGCSV